MGVSVGAVDFGFGGFSGGGGGDGGQSRWEEGGEGGDGEGEEKGRREEFPSMRSVSRYLALCKAGQDRAGHKARLAYSVMFVE